MSRLIRRCNVSCSAALRYKKLTWTISSTTSRGINTEREPELVRLITWEEITLPITKD
jgi:hypothetical protein